MDNADDEDGMDQGGEYVTAHDQLEGPEAARSEVLVKATRRAHVHRPGLHPTFEPARALAQPGAKACWRLFVGGRVDDGRAIAEAREPDAEIGILGDVVSIPSADVMQRGGAEMIRRAAQRHR